MMQIILICNKAPDMSLDAAAAPLEHHHLALLAGSIAHVFAYLSTGSTRAALRAQLLLDRLDLVAAPASQPAVRQLRRALDQREPG